MSEAVAARLNLSYTTMPLQSVLNPNPAPAAGKLTVFVIDSWLARMPQYAAVFQQLDSGAFRDCPVLVPLNQLDADNASNRSGLLDDLRNRMPTRFQQSGNAFAPLIANDAQYDAQLSQVLAAQVNNIINEAAPAPQAMCSLPVL